MRLEKIGLLFVPLFILGVSTPLSVNFPGLFGTQKVLAQTPNDPKLDQNTATKPSASGNFIDYFAEEAQLTGHQGSVNSASFSPDGKLIVTAGTDGTARVWDLSGNQLVELRGHSASVRSASFSPNGKRIVTASFDGTARVWDLSGKQLAELTGHQGNVYSASFSPDGGRIVTASADKTVRMWDASGKLLVEIKGHSGSVYSASFSPDGKRIVTASADKTARVWDLSGKPLAELSGHTDTVWSASFSPDGKRIVTASDDKTARIWDFSGKQLAELTGHQDSVLSASFSPDGQRIATASVDRIALVWDSSGKLVGKLQQHQGSVNSISFSPDGKWILTTSTDSTARVWDTQTKLVTEVQGYQGGVTDASFSPDRQRMITVSRGTGYVWDLLNKQVLILKGHSARIERTSFSPDGKRIAAQLSNDNIALWDNSGKLLAEFKAQEGNVLRSPYFVKFSPDGQRIVSAFNRLGDYYTVRLWDLSGKLLAEFKGHENTINSADFSPDGQRLITSSDDGTARVWDLSGKQLIRLKGENSASFSLDGKLIVTASNDNIARVWDISGKLLAEVKGNSASFSPDGKLIVTTSNDNIARVWDISGKLLAEVKGNSASFSPDGKLIVTASNDNISRVWDISGKLLAELKGHQSYITRVSVSRDGKQIITASGDNTVRVWYLSNKHLSQLRLPETPSSPKVETNRPTSSGSSLVFQSANFSSDGKYIVTASSDKIARVWDTAGNLLTQLKGHLNSVNGASFSPDANLIITMSSDRSARLWDTSGKQLALLKGSNDAVTSEVINLGVTTASFSPDGKLILTISGDDILRIWNSSGKMLTEFSEDYPRYPITNASFSPDGQRIFTSSADGTIQVWDLFGKRLSELPKQFPKGQSSLHETTFSPDGKNLVMISSQDLYSSTRVWVSNLSNNEQLVELKGHQGFVYSANFSPDGKRIVTASSDKTARIWGLSGKLLVEIKGHQATVRSANFSPDGQRVVTASDDGTTRIWDINGKQLAILSLSVSPSSPKVEADRLRDLEFYAPNCSAALSPWQQALNIYREIGDRENEAYILEKLGNAYYCLSDYTKAIESYSQASEIAKKFNYLERQITTLSNLGSVYNTLADYDKAIHYYNDALKILEQSQAQKSNAEVLRGRGNAYNFQGKSDEAIKDYLQALAIDEAAKNSSGVAEAKVSLARIYQSLGDYAKALQYYKETLEFSLIEALAGLGNTYLTLGDTAKAIELNQQSLEKARQQEDKEGEANALNNLANALRQAGKFKEAEQYLRKAIEIWENLRTKLDDANKVSIFEKQSQTYRLLQEILIAQNKPEEALEIAERGRARAFVELLAKRLSPKQNEQPSITPPNIDRIKQIAKAQNATLVEYSIITDTFKVQGKEQTQESELYIWVIKPTGEVAFRRSDLKPLWQNENTTLANLVTSSRAAISVRGLVVTARPDAPNAQNQLKRLHELLIKPISDLLPTQESDKIIFIPQSSLFLVPFPALQDESGKYLIEKHTLLTAPSIQVLELTHQQRQQVVTQGKNALVVGNPTMPKVGFTIGEAPQQLPSLPGAETEAKAIAPLLNTQALIGNQATEAAILPLLPSARIIHLATHGILDDIQGLKSAVALAPSSMAPPLTKGGTGGVEESDGLLTAEELLNLKLNAELVVLSACDTGRGKITGDGVIGLSRSFISAGVPSVIVSLWSVPDAPTALLMTEFYQNLQKNPDKAQALRQAMLTTLKQHPNPIDWGAFTLIGEAQ